MRLRIMTAATALLSAAAAVSAHTGVSGQLGVPTSGVMTPLQNASSSPVVVAPPPPAEQPAPRTPSTQPVVSVPSPSPSSSPSFPARPPVAVTPSAPAPVPFSSENAEPRKREKKRGAQFYAPYLTTTDSLDRAITDQTARVAAHPDDPALRNDLGNLLARRGFAKEAFDQYDKAARLDREFFLADYNAGLLWEKEGRTAPAISAYRRSIKRKPGFPLSRFHLGFLYEKQGRNSIAAREYAKALRVDPSLRWPSRNPLVVQTRLLYRASLENYDRDLASATLSSDGEFADRAVWERLQPQQPVDTSELDSETDETEPQVIGPTKPPTAPLIGGTPSAKTPDARRQQLIDQFRKSRQPVRPNSIPSRTTIPPPPMIPPPAQAQPPPPDENAPVEEEPPPPRTFS